MLVLLLCRFRASVDAWQHHQLLWRTGRYCTLRLPLRCCHTLHFRCAGFLLLPVMWPMCLTFISNRCRFHIASKHWGVTYVQFILYCLTFLFFAVTVVSVSYQLTLNTECVISVQLALCVLLTLCISRLFSYKHSSLQIFRLHWALYICIVFLALCVYEVQFPVNHSKC
jgi:hypothetical protein